MASVSTSHLVLFIASMVVAVGVATTLTANVAEVSSALDRRGDDTVTKIETEIEIISDPGSPDAIYNSTSENVTVLVKNTGGKTLTAEADRIDLLINGTYITGGTATVVGSSSTDWTTGDVVRLTVNRSLGPGEYRLIVRVNGDEDLLRFRV